MVVESYNLTPAELQAQIENTIRVFKEYKLSSKVITEGWLRVWDAGKFYDYTTINENGKCELQVTAGRVGRKISEAESDQLAMLFVNNINKIVSKEIVITPEIANVDPYKPVDPWQVALQIIGLIVAAIAIFYGSKVFFN
jgi:hypothetical protein